MKAISIYALTRNQNMECVQKLERQLSGRDFFLRIKEWELESMKALVKQLELHMEEVYKLRFFYSFQIPKLGKEFDLLQIKDDQIVNIELKSGSVSDEAIRRQLIQNRYYLSVFGKSILSYTYISSEDRLVRLTNHDHIVEGDWKQLCIALGKESPDYEGDIEDLFQIGCIGLIKSIDKFDFDYDVKFSTYAVPLIQGEIRRFLRDYGAIKVSRSLKEMNSKVEQYRQRVIKEKGYEPEIEEIAAALSYDAGEIVMAMEASLEPESLDVPGVYSKTEEYSQEIVDHLSLMQMLERLEPEEQRLIQLRYFEDKTQSETGKLLGISQVQLRLQDKLILQKLKETL